MLEPISVTIKDLAGCGRTITWLGKGARWLEANGELTVNYDPWSCADGTQRNALIAALAWGRVALTIHIGQPDGSVVDLPYDPAKVVGAAKSTYAESKKPINTAVRNICEQDDHMITTPTDRAATAFGFTATKVASPTHEKEVDTATGFSKAAFAASDNHIVMANSDKALKDFVDNPMVETHKEVDSSEPAPEQSTYESYRQRFNQLCADKQFQEAFDLLLEQFGADRITFTKRVVSTIKDYDAIVEKYNLK